MSASSPSGLRKLHLAMDALTLGVAIALAIWLHGHLQGLIPALKELPAFSEYATLAYLIFPLWLVLGAAFDLHSTLDRPQGQAVIVANLVKLHLVGFVLLSAAQFLTQAVINRSVVFLVLGSSLVLMYLERLGLRAWLAFQHRQGHGQRRILLVGQLSGRMADFVRDTRNEPLSPRIVGLLQPLQADDSLSVPPPREMEGLEILGTVGELERVLHDQPVDHVMFFPPCNHPAALTDALATCEALGVMANFSVDLVQFSQARPKVTTFSRHPFVSFDVAPKQPESLALKHGLDAVLAAGLIALLSPVFVAVSLAILAAMGRPVLFWQQRAGLYGRPFRMLKFRSMRDGAEAQRAGLQAINEMQGPVFKASRDPRITRLGQVLRRTSLDELPQLFNVLTGSMSLVGPRPLPLDEQAQIRGWQRRRLSMKPGITCLWQVSGRNDLDFDEWMLLDLQYIDEWSLGLDFTILLKTLPAVLSQRGAR